MIEIATVESREPNLADQVTDCTHRNRQVINGYELVRKYRCSDCEATMTCACDRDIARYVVPHQASKYRDRTGERRQVTRTLVPALCHDCRGETPPTYPRIANRGAATAIHRYYWRELWRTTQLRFLRWCQSQGLPLAGYPNGETLDDYRHRYASEYETIERQVLVEIRAQHENAPIYDTAEPSAAEILTACEVAVRDIRACYLTPTIDRVLVIGENCTDPTMAVGVEEFIASQLRAQGRQAMICESRPFHALFAIMMWLWVQSPDDPRCEVAGFGGRDGLGADTHGLIWIMKPSDFGSPEYGARRAEALEEHLAFIPDDLDEMLWTFDYWAGPSHGLRQYLWAYKTEDGERAREIIRVLGPKLVKEILTYLSQDYWGRYLGWPDLLSWEETPGGAKDPLLTEVKSGGDRVSADQLRWIRDNSRHLKLAFEIAKVHRTKTLARHS